MILQTYTNPLYITGLALTRDIDEDLTLVWANFLEAFALSSTSGQRHQQTPTGRVTLKEKKESQISYNWVA